MAVTVARVVKVSGWELVEEADCPNLGVGIDSYHSFATESGLEVLGELRAACRGPAVVVLSMHSEQQYAVRAIRAGASAYVPKHAAPEEMFTAVRTIAAQQIYLYPSLTTLLVRDYLAGMTDQYFLGFCPEELRPGFIDADDPVPGTPDGEDGSA